MREAFERAIIENPDDVSSYSAYADWLQEQDDPRGEFIAVQMALEDEARSKAERTALKKREKALLKKHEREWLRELAPFVLDEVSSGDPITEPSCSVNRHWRYGFLNSLIIERLSITLAHAIVDSQAASFLQELHIHETYQGYYGDEIEQPSPRVRTPRGLQGHYEYLELIGSSCLHNLRRFQMGGDIPPEDGWCDCHTYTPGIHHILACMERVKRGEFILQGI